MKDSTECAPNGYFFLPIYDGGSYVIRIEGPPGWAFEPSQVAVSITEDNKCNDGEDINFRFTGFSLFGKVVGVGSCPSAAGDGPAGVSVTLSRGDGQAATTASSPGGSFSFTNLLPDTYTLTASHPTWTLEKGTATVSVEFENAVLPEPFVVSGYDVRGEVTSGGDPMMGVEVYLYSDSDPDQAPNPGCPEPTEEGPVPGKKPLCVTASDSHGRFAFLNVPCGPYTVVPRYRSSYTSFDISPAYQSIAVPHGNLVLPAPFQVVGFSIGGSILFSPSDSRGVPGVVIYVDGTQRAITDERGRYTLEQVTTGVYSIAAKKEHLFFEGLHDLRIMPNVPDLPPIYVSAYDLCGGILIAAPPSDLPSAPLPREVILRDASGKQERRQSDAQGKFCFEVVSGQYSVTPVVSAAEQAYGLALTPASIEVAVTNLPVLNAHFYQARYELRGGVVCLSDCPSSLSLRLTRLSPGSIPNLVATRTTSDQPGVENFSFSDVLPGKYRVSVHQQWWCWDKPAVNVEVGEDKGAEIGFTQTGFQLSVTASHDANLVLALAGSDSDSDQLTLAVSRGGNEICLPKSGVWKVTPKSCYRFESETYRYDTSAPRPLQLVVSSYLLAGDIRAQVSGGFDPEIRVNVRRLDAQSANSPGVKAEVEQHEPGVFSYKYWAALGEKVRITPSSSTLLFYPPHRDVAVTLNECQPRVLIFDARPGLFLRGTVTPPVPQVEITISSLLNNRVVGTVFTDDEGHYSAGPLYDDDSYRAAARKEGYQFVAGERSALNFNSMKLVTISVKVQDPTGAGLGSVLLSLSAKSYRSNNVTTSSGSMVFSNLFPGQYFLKPLLKEYVFQPNAENINIKEGETTQVTFTGTRTAFSCYGSVKSLNGDPEKLVVVEALGSNGEREEAQTDTEGQYRIRGLPPNGSYTVRVKSGDNNPRIERSSPSSTTIAIGSEDVRGVDFIAFRRSNKYDISGVVSAPWDQLHSLQVELISSIAPDTVIKTVKLGPHSFFEFPSLIKDKYIVRVRSSQSSRNVVANYSLADKEVALGPDQRVHVSLAFSSQQNLLAPDMPNTSFFALSFFVGMIFVFLYQDTVVKVLQSWLKVLPFLEKSRARKETAQKIKKQQLRGKKD